MPVAGATAPLRAAAAYAAQAGGGPSGPGGEQGGFGGVLSRAMESAVELGRSADAASTQALMGQGSVTEAVLAISRAELALQTTVAVRDRVVAAYQEVMRMPI
ncbi:flagellar hook-basal body complex protein FliE [Falsiroseomonas stagni]|uniref:Flagellar hook-basal body complex protein FliE n=1 Tax=Falsiroseomonas stagni DSM 19981 TaxID=1123062 RepID=A0A1I4CG29_9PROT|nr:flagellar hook-basal body complex protein FliE [Falsiroseomonas stagni]SFK79723.1 flagellar hook-basal body complex protein FliE [Falsiroseomonas stagni DSM 19981]